jgi:uncharacterized protein (DUF1778 family)
VSKVKQRGIGGGCRAAHDAAAQKGGFECECSGIIMLTEAEALGMLDNPPEPNAELLALLQLDRKDPDQ